MQLSLKMIRTFYLKAFAPTKTPKYLPLYQSRFFKSSNWDDIFADPTAQNRYKQILPSLLTTQSGMVAKRYLCTKLCFDPENEVLRISSLHARGFVEQEFHIRNIIPFTYKDMLRFSRLPDVVLPPFVDGAMVYYNRMLKECLICESDGIWNDETINHPKLSLNERFDQKTWIDRLSLME